MNPARVIIVDDHAIFRLGLRRVCARDPAIAVVGEASNGLEAIHLRRACAPQIALLDIHMPVMDGIACARLLADEQPDLGIIMLTVMRDDAHIFDAIRAGARGYLLKDTDEKTLLAAVHAVANGGSLMDPSVAAQVIEAFHPDPGPDDAGEARERLSEIEIEILRLVAEGRGNPEIGASLGFSEKTVANRLTSIYRKLHINNRTQAALYALRKGWTSVKINL